MHAERMLKTEGQVEAGLGNVGTTIASPLRPGAMVAIPPLTPFLLPCTMGLPCALRRPSLLLLPGGCLLLAALGLRLLRGLRGLLLLRGSALCLLRLLRGLSGLLLLRGSALRLLSRLRALLWLGLLLLRLWGPLLLRLLSRLRVLRRLGLLLLRRRGMLLRLLRGLALLLFGRFTLAFLWFVLPRGQWTNRPRNQKQSGGAGRSNELHV